MLVPISISKSFTQLLANRSLARHIRIPVLTGSISYASYVPSLWCYNRPPANCHCPLIEMAVDNYRDLLSCIYLPGIESIYILSQRIFYIYCVLIACKVIEIEKTLYILFRMNIIGNKDTARCARFRNKPDILVHSAMDRDFDYYS